jgi:hypothetical protein
LKRIKTITKGKTVKTQLLMSLILAGSMGSFAQAQEQTQSATTSSAKMTELQKSDEKQKDIDDEITNARMRATLGSKSKWSFKSAMSYSGGSVAKPFERVRPNYRAGANVPSLTNLAGTIGVNYRMTERDSLSAGTGVTIRNPFHDDLGRSDFQDPRPKKDKHGNTVYKNTDRYEASTPYLEYSRAYKAGGMQMISSANYSHNTTSDMTQGMNAIGGLSLDQTVLADFGTSNWSGGMSLSFDTTFYGGDMSADFAAAGALQDDFGYGVYPFAEYTFNDRYSFRTVFGYLNMRHYKNTTGDQAAVESEVPYQSMGIGISVTRDIYLYPNIQFTPLDVRSDRTNVALSANLNLF